MIFATNRPKSHQGQLLIFKRNCHQHSLTAIMHENGLVLSILTSLSDAYLLRFFIQSLPLDARSHLPQIPPKKCKHEALRRYDILRINVDHKDECLTTVIISKARTTTIFIMAHLSLAIHGGRPHINK